MCSRQILSLLLRNRTFIRPVRALVSVIRVLKEGFVAAIGFVDVRLARRLVGRMHIQYRHAAVNHVHSIQGKDVCDGTIAGIKFISQQCESINYINLL